MQREKRHFLFFLSSSHRYLHCLSLFSSTVLVSPVTLTIVVSVFFFLKLILIVFLLASI